MNCWSGALFLLASAAGAWAQAGAQQAAPEVVSRQAPATFNSRVNLVSVPVVVRDKDGTAAGNLRQEDFAVSDKGRIQEITKFTIETAVSAAAGAGSSSERDSPGAPTLPQRFVAFLFDDIHTQPGNLAQGRQAVERQLNETLDAGTRIGVFTTSANTTQDFTGDAQKVRAALDAIHPWEQGLDKQRDCPYISYYLADLLINQDHSLSPGESDQQVISMIQADPALNAVIQEAETCLRSTNLQEVLPQVRNAAQMALRFGMEETTVSLNVMRDLVRSMSVLPGSRIIVMVSPGFLLASEHRLDENDVFDKAIRANITINTMDVRGVAQLSGFEASDKSYTSSAAGQMMQYENTAVSLAQDLLGEVASNTGGRFFHNDNALAQGIKELAARPEYLYVLGFSPDNLKFDGSYHRLKVTLKNGAGLAIEARRGYWAPNHAVDPAEEAKEEIEDAVFSREEILDIPLKLHTEFFKVSAAKAQLTVQPEADLSRLKFKKVDDRNRDTLTVVTGLFDENGRYVKGTETTLNMQLRDQTLESLRSSGLMKIAKSSFDVPPGRYIVRVVVTDAEGRSMAAKNEGVVIP